MKRNLIIIGGIVLLVSIAAFMFSQVSSNDESDSSDTTEAIQTNNGSKDQNKPSEPVEQANDSLITLTAVGDMLPHDSININAETTDGYNYLPYFDQVSNLLESDIAFCNQESPSAGSEYGIAGYPSFNAPKQFSADLNTFGCNVVNLANNHVADRNTGGVEATIANWAGHKTLAVSGANISQAEQDTVSYFEINNTKFAFIAFTDLSNNTDVPGYTVNMFSDDLVQRLTTEAAKNADVVLVSAHWGVEYSPSVSSEQEYWAELLAQNGADIIIGTGPHVLQTIDEIQTDNRTTLVMYSLGNFLSTQLEIDQLIGGVAKVIIDPEDIGNYDVSFTPTYMHYEWTAEQAAREDLLARTNLKLYKLSEAGDALARSLFNTSVSEQANRVTELLNQNREVVITN